MFPGYGSDLIKTFKMSPDGFVQMALQLAIFKMTGTVTPASHMRTVKPLSISYM